MVDFNKLDKEVNTLTLKNFIKGTLFVEFEEKIRLSNGKLTKYYFDIRKHINSWYFNSLVTTAYYETFHILEQRIRNEFPAIRIGGLESGALPIITGLVKDYQMQGFWIRKEPKKYGLKQQIEGDLSNTEYVILVDDVISTGKSILKCIDVLKDYNPRIKVLGVYPLIDRNKEIDNYNIFFSLKERNIEYVPLFSSIDFINEYESNHKAEVTIGK